MKSWLCGITCGKDITVQSEKTEKRVESGHCDCGDRCSCPPGSVQRAACTCWHLESEKPVKIFGLLAFHELQKPLIDKHCFGDCGKVSMGGVIMDDTVGGFWVCCEEGCPWLDKQMDEAYGTTMSFGRPHELYVRTLTDAPADSTRLCAVVQPTKE